MRLIGPFIGRLRRSPPLPGPAIFGPDSVPSFTCPSFAAAQAVHPIDPCFDPCLPIRARSPLSDTAIGTGSRIERRTRQGRSAYDRPALGHPGRSTIRPLPRGSGVAGASERFPPVSLRRCPYVVVMTIQTAPDALDASVESIDAPAAPPSMSASHAPQQHEMPLAMVLGQPVLQIPQDLYIPPDALEVILEAFEGPLDLLLYLIRRQNLDILDIPVAEITRQYVKYIEVMREMRFELAAEYLVMAAILAEIKSRMLLPRPPSEEGLEDDPRADLVRRLQDYERFKQAAEDLDGLPRMDRDTAPATAFVPDRASVKLPPPVQLKEMLLALHDVLKRAELFTGHAIKRDALSVRQRMTDVLSRLSDGSFHRFESLFEPREGKLGVVVTFLSILELAKERLLDIVQEHPNDVRPGERRPNAPIYVKSLATRDGDNDTGPLALRSEFDEDVEDFEDAMPSSTKADETRPTETDVGDVEPTGDA